MEDDFKFKPFIKWTIPIALLALFFLIAIVGTTIYFSLINQAKSNLEETASLVRQDLIVNDGRWDVSLYNSNNSIPNSNPLYIITSEGFVIERSRPIHGLLDLSRYSNINQYLFPTTVETVTNESWRALANPILSGEQPVGVIFATFYKPEEKDLVDIDKALQDVVEKIRASIKVNGDTIDISGIDSRKLPYSISYQIVNRFNKVLYQSNNINSVTRMPAFIDRSYVENQLKTAQFREVRDDITHTKYLTLTTPLLNEKNLIIGIIVTGVSIELIHSIITNFLIISLLTGGFILIVFIPVSYILIKKVQKSKSRGIKQKPLQKLITFAKSDCKLTVDGTEIEIPYSSYQYYFCQALFQKPHKKWEADELLEIFGEKDFGSEKWRKVYDTMVALNKKTTHLVDKLFIVRNKRYSLSTQLVTTVRFVT